MKLLIISNNYPNPVQRQRGVFVENRVCAISKYSDAVVISPLPWFPKFKSMKRFKKYYDFACVPEKWESNNITIHYPKYFMLPKIGETFHAILLTIRLFHFLKKLHKIHQFTAINVQWLYPDGVSVAWIAKILGGIKIVLSAVGSDVNEHFLSPVKRWQILKALRLADHITTVSHNLKESIASNGISPNKITVIHNGIDIIKFSLKNKKQCQGDLNINNFDKIITFVGRLSKKKGILDLLDALDRLTKINREKILLQIIGDGPERENILSKINTLGIKDNVHIYGTINHDVLPNILGASDIFCLPSYMEGCPNVIIEAGAVGTPICASNVGGIPELITEETGCLFNPGKIDEIAFQLDNCLKKEWDRKKISDHYCKRTWDIVGKEYINVIRDLEIGKDFVQ